MVILFARALSVWQTFAAVPEGMAQSMKKVNWSQDLHKSWVAESFGLAKLVAERLGGSFGW